ncbi:hypothetical protein [Sphingobium aromaticiconvertens]|uniref:hypothetical protein n=1 Tax=Sphingobium aromaticiconvertens TaxID=365341 RepID=UPI0030187B1E
MTHILSPSDAPPVIEVTRNPAGISMCQLVRDAYEASRERQIILLLNGVTVEEVDAALDPIVPLYSLDIPGVKYVLFEGRERMAGIEQPMLSSGAKSGYLKHS